MTEQEKFKEFAIVELFGHSRIAGLVSEQEIAGSAFVRVDVPEVDGAPAFTKFYGTSAIYSITPVAESVAKLAAGRLQVRPINVWIPEIDERPQLPMEEEPAF